jgi:Berberine and berberine like
VARIRQALPPLWELVTPMPYVALQQMFDEANAWGFYGHAKGTYLEDLSDEAIEVVADYLPRKSSRLSALLLHRLDEAYSEAGEDDTAFSGGRSPRFGVFILAVCPTPDLLVADRAWARGFWEALHPLSLGDGSYVNTGTEFGEDRVRAAYGHAKYQRLATIKATYDPRNLFHHNANIQPA